jgi:hypothetical protein
LASVQNCENYPPARRKNKVFKNKVASACCMNMKHNKKLIDFIQQQMKYSTKITKIHGTIKWKFYKKTIFIDISFCLFCNFRGSKPTRTRTQNRKKQRNSLGCNYITLVNPMLNETKNLWKFKTYNM